MDRSSTVAAVNVHGLDEFLDPFALLVTSPGVNAKADPGKEKHEPEDNYNELKDGFSNADVVVWKHNV